MTSLDIAKAKAVNPKPVYTVNLASVDTFLMTTGLQDDWPAFKQRLNEMNHKNANGSRSGDIVTFLDGERGYLTVNNTHEIYPGWHGGPTKSESFVPLMFAMPGNDFVDESGNTIDYPAAFVSGYANGLADPAVSVTVSNADDAYRRNWQLPHFLKKILKEFRDE